MNRFEYDLANDSDDRLLSELLRSTPTDGSIRIAFCRNPSFFAAAEVEGDRHQTVVCREQEGDAGECETLIGMGSLSSQQRFVNGNPEEVGYLSGLRIHRDYRSLGILARGFQRLREIHQQRPLAVYLTTIAEGNQNAWRLLTSGRAGLPIYHYLSDFHSIAIPISRRRSKRRSMRTLDGYELRQAGATDVAAILEFWTNHGVKMQFFPIYDAEALLSDAGKFRGMRPTDIILACRNGEIVGTLGMWNQMSFRQSIVDRYSPWLRRVKPMVNTWSRFRGRWGLPDVDQPLRIVMAATPVVRNDSRACFRLLVDYCLHELSGSGMSHFVIGLGGHDPLLNVLTSYPKTVYRTRLCRVDWNDGLAPQLSLDDRSAYLEVGAL